MPIASVAIIRSVQRRRQKNELEVLHQQQLRAGVTPHREEPQIAPAPAYDSSKRKVLQKPPPGTDPQIPKVPKSLKKV
eukprot:2388302-Amphidinium_carterae.1